MPGAMSWEEMDWMFPDYEDTGLIYHGTDMKNLASIFSVGLLPGYRRPDYETIYNALHRHRPDNIPDWVDPRICLFGYINRKRFPSPAGNVVIGCRAGRRIIERTWIGLTDFSNWLYAPAEAGYLDTEELSRYYQTVVEPACAEAYWKMSMSFSDNLRIRHDRLLCTQRSLELLICTEVAPELLSLQALFIKSSSGVRTIMRPHCIHLFQALEDRLIHGQDTSAEFEAIEEYNVPT